jgi:aryl-alcohol dehydrogenase-like predicted oxidoreductase
MSISGNGTSANGSASHHDPSTLPIKGKATPEMTTAFRDRHEDYSQTFKTLGATGLECSPVGFGTYRVDVRVPTHRGSLAKALRMGVNLIDTSANYADGMSERLIGEVLRGMTLHDLVRREEIIIVSKGGYLQGENYERIRARVESPNADISAGSELAELTRYSQGLWHSIHPDFLKDQITRSLDRLQLETIDVYLLHNPEYYIQHAIKENIPEDEARDEYERRIKKAFAYLEEEVAEGRIQYYGISSNTFPRPESSIDRTSLEKAWHHAEEIKRERGLDRHHFAVIQLPLNIFEPQGATEPNQLRATQSVIDFAREHNIGVLINRPLNAIVGRKLHRLADFPAREHPAQEDISELVHDLTLQENEFKDEMLEKIDITPQASDAVMQLLALGKWLDGQWMNFNSFEEWKDVSTTVLAPRIQYVFDVLRPISKENKPVFEFLSTYAESADEVMEHINNYYSTQANERAAKIHKAIDALIPPEYSELSLSQKAVLLIRSIPGVSSVLVGMRTEEYVDDVVYGLQAKPIEDVEKVWQRMVVS